MPKNMFEGPSKDFLKIVEKGGLWLCDTRRLSKGEVRYDAKAFKKALQDL
jgi:hypothetical protein